MSEHDLLMALAALAIILLVGRGVAELAQRARQPEVLGELLGGFLLGPSVLGALFPSLYHHLFTLGAPGLVLSGASWLGAILLLLLAGMEVDLAILRAEARPGALAAAFAIVPSIAAGTLFAWLALGRPPAYASFLGVVLSVTAVSVAAKIMMERGVLRRKYGQVILAAGVASEVVVWLLVSLESSLRSGSPLLAARSALFAVAFFAFMMTLGRRFVFWTMRRVTDRTQIVRGQLSLILVLTFVAAAITQWMGLHALLGAFVLGVVLAIAPRKNEQLVEALQNLTIGFLAPVFFVLAGMRVNILQLGSPSAIAAVLALLVVATVVKVGFGAVGGRLGGLRGWESVLVGLGLNLKGGTDVVVAIVGAELGLLPGKTYTMYAVVAILTVLFSPALMAFLERRTPPTEKEEVRLEKEEAERRSYVPSIERVLVPVAPHLLSSLAASVVERLANSKHGQGQIFDITEYVVEQDSQPVSRSADETRSRLGEAGTLQKVELTRRRVDVHDALEGLLAASEGYDLIAIGAHPPEHANGTLSLGELQDQIIDQARADILVAVDRNAKEFQCSKIRRILVPTNGLEYSMAAGDIAAALAEVCGAELVVFHVVQPGDQQEVQPGLTQQELTEPATGVVQELAFRARRLGVHVDEQVRVGDNVAEEITRALRQDDYQLLVLGAVDRGRDNRLYLGQTVGSVLTAGETPSILLVRHA